MSFENPRTPVYIPCIQHTQAAHGKGRLVRQRPRWALWGRAWRARDKRGPARRQPPSGLYVVEANHPPTGRNAPSSVFTSRTPSGSSALTLSSGSILKHKYTHTYICIFFFNILHRMLIILLLPLLI